MGSNFNVDVNPINKEEENEDTFENEVEDSIIEELEEEKSSKNSNKYAKTKLIKTMIIFMAVCIVLIIILWVFSALNPKTQSYSDIEKVLKKAAIAYFADYPDQLPQSEGAGVEIDHTNLVAAEKMKDLSKYLKEGVSCTAVVQVQKTGDDYLYTPYLNCGDSYITTEFYKAVISQGTVGQGQYGLYKINGEYVYRGENVNNYVELDEGLWRIVKVTSNNNVVLVKDLEVGFTLPYDDRYNPDHDWKSGINSYSPSRIRDSIERLYQDPDKDKKEVFLSNNDKKKIINFDLCIGKRTVGDTSSDNSIECKTTQPNTKVGLLTVSDYMRASIDSNCTSTLAKSCSNYNYLKTRYHWWLVTANSQTTHETYRVEQSGVIKSVTSSNYSNVRPVIYLNNKIMYKSGKGTKKKPFKVK